MNLLTICSIICLAVCFPLVTANRLPVSTKTLPVDKIKTLTTEGKSSHISDAILALVLAQLRRTSNFPTAFTTANISEQCRKDSQDYHSAYVQQHNWALKMFESSGLYPAAFYGGRNVHSVGLFDECLAVKAEPYNNSDTSEFIDTTFPAKFCSAFFNIDSVPYNETDFNGTASSAPPEQRDFWLTAAQIIQLINALNGTGPKIEEPRQRPTRFYSYFLPSVDFCIPASCSAQDFSTAVASIVGQRAFSYDGNEHFLYIATLTSEDYCWTEEEIESKPELDGADIAVTVTLSVIGSLVLLATLHEALRQYRDLPMSDHLAFRTLHCFSLLNNGKKILSTKVNSSENLSCLNGIRVISTTWVILAHSYYLAAIHRILDLFVMAKESKTWQFHGGVTMATMAVDTFFLMSGLLVSYLVLRELDRNKGRFNVPLFYIHRYLRLTPVYAIVLGFIATLLVYVDVGPSWQLVRFTSDSCRWNWWSNLLYINNYVQIIPGARCMEHTWYLACDMQMFLLSPLFIYPLWKWWKIGLAWTVFAIVASLSGVVAIFAILNLPWNFFFPSRLTDNTSESDWYDVYYVQTWARMPSYLLGILLGWVLHRTKNDKINMAAWAVISGWVSATVVGLSVIYGLVPYLDGTSDVNSATRVLYGSFSRFAWAAAVGWLIFACIKGYGGFVNRFLSWKAFMPLGRLTYVAYLIHYDYLNAYWAHARSFYYHTVWDYVQYYLGALMSVFLLAFVISAAVEASFLNLEKLLFNEANNKPLKTR